MGTFSVQIQIVGPNGAAPENITAVVDTGASHTVVPAPLLERLGVERRDRLPISLADGRTVESDVGVGEALIRIEGRSYTSPVVFGEPDGAVLLGAITLEAFALGVDPVARRLIPVRGIRY